MALHAECFGRTGGGTPLVLLHGFGGLSSAWRAVAEGLDPGIPVLAYDLPGHGRSVSEGAGGAGRVAKAIHADLAARKIEGFHLCGHSLGGAVAALIALRNSERVRSLTLLAPGGFGPDIQAGALAAWRDATSPELLRAALAPMAAAGFRFGEELIADLAAARSQPGAHEALCEIFAAMVDGEGRQGVLPVEALGGLTMPVSVLWGDEDGILPVSQALQLPRSIAVTVLSGAGHMLIEERPDAVVAALRAVPGR